MIQLLFTRRRHIGSWLIRFVTWSEYSHVDILLDGNYLIGAIAPEGVVVHKADYRLKTASKAVIMELPVSSKIEALEYARSQIGKSYDWLGVLGIGLHRNWQENDKWSCAELAAMALDAGGQKPFDSKFHHRITPQDLLMLNFEKRRIK
jgi:uncharacterized protein YycO